MLGRDWRGGEMAVLLAALVLAVSMVSGISGFAAALQAALRLESNSFLAADVAVSDSRPLPQAWRQRARREGLREARTLSFSSMAFAGEAMALTAAKAVSDDYPLRGELLLSDTPYGETRRQRGAPARGSVWIDPRLFALLDLSPGGRLQLGDAEFTVAAALRGEPDRRGGFLGVGPRLMLNAADIPATGIVQPGSRVRYRQLFAGDGDRVQAFRDWLRGELDDGQRLRDVDNDQPGVGRALDRAERFLLLGGGLAVILAGVAVALAARRFAERHQNHVALLRSLGTPRARIQRLYAGYLLSCGLLATLVGWLLALGLQALALRFLGSELPARPDLLAPRPYLLGAVTSLVCLACFAWPPLSRLCDASPLRVLRSDLPLHSQRDQLDYLLGLAAVCLLMWWYSDDAQLTAIVLGGLAALVAAGAALAWLLLRGGRQLGMQAGSVWRLALASLQRHGLANALQLVLFAITLMLLLLLTLLRGALLDDWRRQLPEGAPNHFVLNIAPEELATLRGRLDAAALSRERLYPMLRGRVVAVDGTRLAGGADREGPAGAGDGAADDRPRQRGANFTWSAELPESNEIVAGRWWDGAGEALVSVERGFAEGLGVQLGDALRLRIGSETLTVRVASLREVDWQSFKPNFFMIFPPGLLDDYPVTWMTSFHLPAERKGFLNELLRAHPTITVIEVDAIMQQLRTTLDRVSAAIELVLLLVVVTGLLVLLAGVQASMDLRLREAALLRALGAGRRLLLGGIAIEFTVLGALAGVLAVAAAEAALWALQRWVFEGSYYPSPEVWPLAVGAGALLIAALGLLGCRRVIRASPLTVLREL